MLWLVSITTWTFSLICSKFLEEKIGFRWNSKTFEINFYSLDLNEAGFGPKMNPTCWSLHRPTGNFGEPAKNEKKLHWACQNFFQACFFSTRLSWEFYLASILLFFNPFSEIFQLVSFLFELFLLFAGLRLLLQVPWTFWLIGDRFLELCDSCSRVWFTLAWLPII